MAGRPDMNVASPRQRGKQLGRKLAQIRLARNILQAELAETAGISERTLRRLESGDGATLDTFIRVLAALNLGDNLDLLVPDPSIRPMERLRTSGNERQRSSATKEDKTTGKWEWGTGD